MHKKTDSEIEQWVLRELRLEKDLRSPEICVQSHDGVVTLHGSVPNYANKLAAQQAAYRVVDIADVVDDIRVKPCGVEMTKSSTTVGSESLKPGALLPPMQIEDAVARSAIP